MAVISCHDVWIKPWRQGFTPCACSCTSVPLHGPDVKLNSIHVLVIFSMSRPYIDMPSWFPCRPRAFGGTPSRHSGVKVYVLTSWCKWVQYPAPRPPHSPSIGLQSVLRRAATAHHAQNIWKISLIYFYMGKLIAKLHRGFSTQCFAAPLNYLFWDVGWCCFCFFARE